MANEINISASLTASKNGASVSGTVSDSMDLSGTEISALVQAITSGASVAVDIGGSDTIQALLMKNLDSTASIDVALDSANTNKISTIPPGKGILLLNPPTELYARGSVGTPDYFVVCAES